MEQAVSRPVPGKLRRMFNDMSIGTQLRLGLGLILALVVVLGALAWRQTDLLWLQTRTMYEHPLQVREAIGNLEVDILTMRLGMKDLMLARDDQKIAATAEESASASEELNAQAEEMKGFVGKLAEMVGGSGTSVSNTQMFNSPISKTQNVYSRGLVLQKKHQVRPKQVRPMDDNDFSDF